MRGILLAALLLASSVSAQTAAEFPFEDLGLTAAWKSELAKSYADALKGWKGSVLPFCRTTKSAEVVVNFDHGDVFTVTTRPSDPNSTSKKQLRELHDLDQVEVLFDILGADDARAAATVAYKLQSLGSTDAAKAALALSMRVNGHQRTVLSKVAGALFNEPEPEGGFRAIPDPLSLVDRKRYQEYLDGLAKKMDGAMKTAGDLLGKKQYTRGRREFKFVIDCFDELKNKMSEPQLAQYDSLVKTYDAAAGKLDTLLQEVLAMGSYERLRGKVADAKAAFATDITFARRVAQAYVFKHDDVAKNMADWLKDGRDFRSSMISMFRPFADGKDDDEMQSREYLRFVIGKMFAYRSYQDILEKIPDAAVRNGKDAVKYSPDDPMCIKVDQSALQLKKNLLKNFNAPGKFADEPTFLVGTGFYRPWYRRYWYY